MSESHSTGDHAQRPALPEEPKSPWWLPALGAALFVIVGLWWATSSPDSGRSVTPGGAASASSASGRAAQPAKVEAKPAAPAEGAPRR